MMEAVQCCSGHYVYGCGGSFHSDHLLLLQSHSDLMIGCSLIKSVVLKAKLLDDGRTNAKVDALVRAAGG